jgi:periplasmic mercuric ion binding protein
MKKALLISIFTLLISNYLFAQADKALWITIKSANLKCWECRESLDKYLIVENNSNFEKGIIQWKYNLLQGEIKLQYFPDRVSPDQIRTAMNNAGFDADTEKATEDAYKKLSALCKRAEDGGGPQPRKPCHMEPYKGN